MEIVSSGRELAVKAMAAAEVYEMTVEEGQNAVLG